MASRSTRSRRAARSPRWRRRRSRPAVEPIAVAVSPNGQSVYVVDNGSSEISQYTVGAGGALAAMTTPTVAAGAASSAIAVSPNGQSAYVVNEQNGVQGVYQYTVGAGGALTPMATPTVGTALEPNGIAVSPNGQYVYVANYGEPPPSRMGSRSTRLGRAARSRRWRRRWSRAVTGRPRSR